MSERSANPGWVKAPTIDAAMLMFAQSFWKATYGHGMSDAEASSYCFLEEARIGDGLKPSSTWAGRYQFAAKWADGGYVRLISSHRYAAALMATSVDRDVIDEIHVPSKAFMVNVPDGILTVPYQSDYQTLRADDRSECRDYNRICLAQYDGWAHLILMDVHAVQMIVAPTIADALFGEGVCGSETEFGEFTPQPDVEWPDKDRKIRVLTLARRYVIGLLLAMQDRANFRDETRPGKTSRRGREEPQHRNVIFGTPVSIDARPAIARYLGVGGKNPPSVQVLVRGHHKRQVVGVGRSGRRVIWVQPYWRGPEDAPILARPFAIGPKP